MESSGDLQNWITVATSVNGAPFSGLATVIGEVPGTALRTVTIVDPLSDLALVPGKGFLRARVSR